MVVGARKGGDFLKKGGRKGDGAWSEEDSQTGEAKQVRERRGKWEPEVRAGLGEESPLPLLFVRGFPAGCWRLLSQEVSWETMAGWFQSQFPA